MPPPPVPRDRLRPWLATKAPLLYPVVTHFGRSRVCVGRLPRPGTLPGFARCYQCDRHLAAGGRLLADAVVPISYAVKGTAFADGLWRYKSRLGPDPSSRALLLALLLVFLADHGPCVWRSAGMPAPLQLAVVPAGSGRDEAASPAPAALARPAAARLRPQPSGPAARAAISTRTASRSAEPGPAAACSWWTTPGSRGPVRSPPQLPSNGPESGVSPWSSRAATSIPVTLCHARWSPPCRPPVMTLMAAPCIPGQNLSCPPIKPNGHYGARSRDQDNRVMR